MVDSYGHTERFINIMHHMN